MSLSPSTIVDTFSAAGAFVWNKRLGAKFIIVQIMAGGCAGNSGTVTAPGANAGVNPGGGGGYGEFLFPASTLPNTVNGNVGAGGAPIAGGAGNSGGNTNFGKYCFVRGGTNATINGGGSGYPGINIAATGFQMGFTGAGNNQNNSARAGSTGGTGGGFSNATTVTPSIAGGGISTKSGTSSANAGVADTGAFTPLAGGAVDTDGASFDGISPFGGTGGGGGTALVAGNGHKGGNGGYPGGGGGGGANAFTGFTAGLGGTGGDGIAVVTTYF